MLRVISNDEMVKQEQAEVQEAIRVRESEDTEARRAEEGVAGYVRKEYERYKNERSRLRLNERYLDSLRTYNGQYDHKKLAEIHSFGGSTVYARITTSKCRGATSLLRDVYLGGERPWTMKATPDPEIPKNIVDDIEKLVGVEAASAASLGQPVDEMALLNRRAKLYKAAKRAAKKQADQAAEQAAIHIEDLLVEGGFYSALKEFLTDLPIFPFACIKGPEIKNSMELVWEDGKLSQKVKPRMYWRRVSPFDLFISPEASYAQNAQIIERIRLRRNDLNQLIDVVGYNTPNIRAVLAEYPHGIVDAPEEVESERADYENRENPNLNRGDVFDTLEFHGFIRGEQLLDYGFTPEQIKDPLMDYSVVCWVVGRYTIKVHINPNPRQRHPYYITSFDKVPGSVHGNALPDIISDLQDVANATLRSLVNNMSISSGPQVMINADCLSASTDPNTLYPWKRWRFTSDPMGNNTIPPIDFFQPSSNAQELLTVYKAMTEIADEISAIPRYVTGGQKVGGAASTASGLSMLMNNVAKVLQNVAASVDEEVLQPLLQDLYILLLLSNPAPYFNGDTKVMVRGVAVAVQKETERMRKLELLNITANPIDMQIIGTKGRAGLLREISKDLGMPGDEIIPDDDTLEEIQQLQQQQQQMAAAAQGDQAQSPQNNTSGRMTEEFDKQHLTNMQ